MQPTATIRKNNSKRARKTRKTRKIAPKAPYSQSPEELARAIGESAQSLYETQPKMTLLGLCRLIRAAYDKHPIQLFKL